MRGLGYNEWSHYEPVQARELDARLVRFDARHPRGNERLLGKSPVDEADA
jgi:hypothetical protein